MNREMRRAWRRDIKERKRHKKRRSIVAPTGSDQASYGNNDKLWDEVTEDETLQQILYDLMHEHPVAGTPGPSGKLQRWLEDNIAGCAAEVVAGRMYLPNGDPGYPPEYCDNLVAPGRGEYCEEHEAE